MKTMRLLAILGLIVSGASHASASGGLPFIRDDYARALKDARQHHLPVFVEVWAPW